MAPPAQSSCDQVVDTCATLLQAVYETILGMGKALLPAGVLARKSVTGEIVLVTGSGSQLGRLMAIEFGKLGARVVLWDMNEKTNLETKKLVEEQGAEAFAYTVNVMNRDEIFSTATRVKEEVGSVNILINNAGVVNGKSLLESSNEAIERTIAVNTTALLFTTKAFLGDMLDANHGHLVTIASMAGKCGIPYLTDYCASKFGAVGFSESIMAELFLLGKDGVHVSTICPYFIDTGMFEGVATKCPTLLPILQPEYVVDRIMEAVLTNKETLCLPKFCYVAPFLASILPQNAINIISDYLGLYHTMDNFVGRVPAKQ